MEKLATYRAAIREILNRHTRPINVGEIEVSQVIDDEHGHYQVLMTGWSGKQYHFGPVISIQLKPTGRLWLHHNGTESDLAQELLDLGVAREDIVFGWLPPATRPFTGFAVA